ncbi:hypothetical protein [Streptomyces sp. 351MFTsu5.1]|uniref:hypothetical protein n=1 Tax=Streptomyces sp. 351MFTsu5.1 TaxID=1172180 RepID=UPI00036E345A|nr:hypothetical protein [Streptomyces sp. 351MFTsu5.1]
MATFKSTRYPHLTLQDEKGVWAQFKGGEFETSDASVVKRLRALPEEEGIVEAKSSGKDSEPKAPAKSASKDDWVAWAVSCGADPDEAAAATRDDLAAKYADASPQQ